MNAIAIVPNDLLSAGDMCDTVNDNDDKMDLATVTEHLDKKTIRGKPHGKSDCACSCQ